MKKDRIGRKARTGIYWSVSLKGIQQIYHFFVLIVVARILGPKDFGVMALAIAVVFYMNNLTSFGFTGALVQKNKINQMLIDSVFTLNLTLSLVLAPACIFLSKFIADIFNAPRLEYVVPHLALILPISSFINIPMALLRRDLKFKLHSFIDFGQYLIFSTSMLIMVLLGSGLWALVYSPIISQLSAAFVILMKTKWKPRIYFSLTSIKEIADYGAWDMLRYHIDYIDENFSYYAIGYFHNTAAVGLYERANSIATMVYRKVQTQVSGILFSTFSKFQDQDQNKRLFEAVNKSYVTAAIIVFPALIGLAVISPYLVSCFLGSKWTGMVVPMQFLAIASIFKVLGSVISNASIAVGEYRKQTKISATLILLLICMVLGVVEFGIPAVSAVVLIHAFVLFLANAFLFSLKTEVGLSRMLVGLLPVLFSSLIMTILLSLLSKTILSDIHLLNMIVLILCGFLSYSISLYFLARGVSKEAFRAIFGDLKFR